MPPKTLKNFLIEIVLFITMVTITGHLTANFWERYVVQKELSHMKHSLDHLKVKVQNIGNVYDDLQEELIDLARINSKASISPTELCCKKPRALDHKILRNLNLLLVEVDKGAQYLHTSYKDIDCNDIVKNNATNATTFTRYPVKSTSVGSESTLVQNECPLGTKCKYSHPISKMDVNKCCENYYCKSCHDHKFVKF